MEVEELHPTQPPCKFSRIGNGRVDSSKIGTIKGSGGAGEDHHLHHHHHPRQFQADVEDGEAKMAVRNPAAAAVTVAGDGATNRLRGWHHSRIIRVSRASGGKDRHSKVWTSKGLRDRRVRLSVTTAIQFYDLQDRLGYDQPSKAVEWLIKAAADAIAELPSLNACFPDIPKQLMDDQKRNPTAAAGSTQSAEQGFDSADLELREEEEDPGGNYNPNQNHQLSKSACSSNSETSKGSGLSLARSDVRVNRVKAARERAKEKAAAKEKEKDATATDSRISHHQQHHSINTIAQNSSSFTELLTGGIGGSIPNNNGANNNNNNNNNNDSNNNNNVAAATTITTSPSEVNLFHTAATRPWPLTAMDYFGTGLLGPTASSTRGSQQQHCSSAAAFPGQIQLGNSIHHQQQQQQGMTMSMSIPQFNVVSTGESHHGHHHHHHHHQQEQQLLQQHFPFVSDHLMPVTTTQGGGGPVADYNLNFTISSGLAGFNRGTLQSNSSPSPSLLPPQLQRFASHIDGSTTHLPFFIGGGAPQHPLENHHHNHNHHHQHQQLFPPGLQLCYSDGNNNSSSSRQSDHKGKGKNN